jgi:hypothetical protein
VARQSIKQAISYCGLCGAEKSSADKVMRTPISKTAQQAHSAGAGRSGEAGTETGAELALSTKKQRGNRNRATLAVAGKMVAWMVAVERRKQDFVPANSEAWQPKKPAYE